MGPAGLLVVGVICEVILLLSEITAVGLFFISIFDVNVYNTLINRGPGPCVWGQDDFTDKGKTPHPVLVGEQKTAASRGWRTVVEDDDISKSLLLWVVSLY